MSEEELKSPENELRARAEALEKENAELRKYDAVERWNEQQVFELCPFCNEFDSFVNHQLSGAYWIECRHCNAQGPYKRTIDEAIAAWNDRPIEKVLREKADVFDILDKITGENCTVTISGNTGNLISAIREAYGGYKDEQCKD